MKKRQTSPTPLKNPDANFNRLNAQYRRLCSLTAHCLQLSIPTNQQFYQILLPAVRLNPDEKTDYEIVSNIHETP